MCISRHNNGLSRSTDIAVFNIDTLSMKSNKKGKKQKQNMAEKADDYNINTMASVPQQYPNSGRLPAVNAPGGSISGSEVMAPGLLSGPGVSHGSAAVMQVIDRRGDQDCKAKSGKRQIKLKISDHNFLHLSAIFLGAMTFNFTILFTSGALGHKLGLFINNTGGLSEKFNLEKYLLEVTPADWSFYQGALIYAWQSIWITYGVFSVCRKTEYGYFYRAFPVLPPILYVVFSFALACNISWLLIWDREYMEVALVFINLMTCNLYICLIVSLRRLNEYGHVMARLNLTRDIWLIRIFVHNGLAMFAAWGSVAAMFNFAVVLTYGTGAKLEVGSTVSLAIFTLEILAWFIFDNFVYERLLRYVFTPYIVIIVSIIGILSRNWVPEKPNSIFTMSLFTLVSLLAVIKTSLAVYRHYKHPLFTPNEYKYRRPVVSFEARQLIETQT